MAMLAKAKESSEKKDDKKKKHKHPAAQPPAQPSEAPDESSQPAADDEGDADSQQPADDASEGGGGAASSDGPEDQGEGAQPEGGDEGDQGDAQQGGQGPAPVPSPQAPGAGDDTSGGADTPAPGAGEGDTGGDETPGADTAAGPGSESSIPQIPMSPGLKDEFERAMQMLMQELYAGANDAAAKGIIGGLQPDGPGKLRSAIHLSLVVAVEIIKKLGSKTFPAQIVLPFVKEVTAHVMDLGQQIKQIQYTDQESVAIFGAVYQGAMRIVGVTHGNVKQVAHHLGRKVLSQHAQQSKKMLEFCKPGVDALAAQGGQQGVGAPQTAGPQSGAAPGTQATPQAGAPPQQPPPQGGPLAQAAAASPMAQGAGQNG